MRGEKGVAVKDGERNGDVVEWFVMLPWFLDFCTAESKANKRSSTFFFFFFFPSQHTIKPGTRPCITCHVPNEVTAETHLSQSDLPDRRWRHSIPLYLEVSLPTPVMTSSTRSMPVFAFALPRPRAEHLTRQRSVGRFYSPRKSQDISPMLAGQSKYKGKTGYPRVARPLPGDATRWTLDRWTSSLRVQPPHPN